MKVSELIDAEAKRFLYSVIVLDVVMLAALAVMVYSEREPEPRAPFEVPVTWTQTPTGLAPFCPARYTLVASEQDAQNGRDPAHCVILK